MKLYGHPLSSCTRKILITLAEKETSADFELVDLLEGANRQPAHLERHPFGMIPVLEDDGFVLYESRAIIRYLDHRLAGVSLTPKSPADAARMDQWLSVDQSYVAPHTSTLVAERVVKPHRGLPVDHAAEAAAEAGLARALGVLDRELGRGPHLAGETFSLADISLMPYVAGLPMLSAGHLLERAPRVGAWWERVSARASWKRAVAQPTPVG